MRPRKKAKALIGRRVIVTSVTQAAYGPAELRPVFGRRMGMLSDVGKVRCYLNYGTAKEFSAPWKMIASVEEVK